MDRAQLAKATSIRQDLHRKLKVAAAKQGTTVSAILESLIDDYLGQKSRPNED